MGLPLLLPGALEDAGYDLADDQGVYVVSPPRRREGPGG